MHRLLVTLVVASALIAASFVSSAFAAAPTEVRDTEIGQVLAAPNGSTLYTFDNDPAGQSACVDDCADRWAPHMAAASDEPQGEYTVISRPDGSKQWAYKGKPLYTLKDDAAPGETNGEGEGGVWHAARP